MGEWPVMSWKHEDFREPKVLVPALTDYHHPADIDADKSMPLDSRAPTAQALLKDL